VLFRAFPLLVTVVFPTSGSFYLSAYLLNRLLILVYKNLTLTVVLSLFLLQDIFLSFSLIGLNMSIAVNYNNIKAIHIINKHKSDCEYLS
jgi:hypothetical protein